MAETALQQERVQIRADLLAGRVPKRVFVTGLITLEAACGYAGVDLHRAHYDLALMEKAYTAICRDFYFDALPLLNIRHPVVYEILGAKNWVLASNGAIQHPEIEPMAAEDYDDFIADPEGVINGRILPRVCEKLGHGADDKVLEEAMFAWNWSNAAHGEIFAQLEESFGYAPGFITGTIAEAPFDFLADQFRGFKGITVDCRRMPDKVEAAVEKILPMMVRKALPKRIRPGDINFMPLHLAPYINMKAFERLYWPTMKALVEEVDRQGVHYYIFAEQNWMRYLDHLATLPPSAILRFEDGDPRRVKETCGKDHIISGFYDTTITLTRSKEACIDEAKRLVDTCAPGGRFYFSLNKSIMDIRSIDPKKFQAVLDWLYINTNY